MEVLNFLIRGGNNALLGGLTASGLKRSLLGRLGTAIIPSIHEIANDLDTIEDKHVWTIDGRAVAVRYVVPVRFGMSVSVRTRTVRQTTDSHFHFSTDGYQGPVRNQVLVHGRDHKVTNVCEDLWDTHFVALVGLIFLQRHIAGLWIGQVTEENLRRSRVSFGNGRQPRDCKGISSRV